jgi:hypothetical protein
VASEQTLRQGQCDSKDKVIARRYEEATSFYNDKFLLFFFACPKKNNKKTTGNELQPIPDTVFQFGFCNTLMKSSGT